MTAHDHPGERLHWGCDACIHEVRKSKQRDAWQEATDDHLRDVWDWLQGGNAEGCDLEFVGLLLVERGVISFDEFCEVAGFAPSEAVS